MALHSSKHSIFTFMLIAGVLCVTTIHSVGASQKQKFCGPKLARALAELCDAYPTLSPPPMKRPSDAKGMTMNDYNSPDGTNFEDQSADNRMYNVVNLKEKPTWMKLFYPKHDPMVLNDLDYVNEIIPDRFMLGKRGPGKGIVEECCRKGCTYEYLMVNYCA